MDRDNRDFRMAGVYPENPFIPAIPVQTSVSLSLVSRLLIGMKNPLNDPELNRLEISEPFARFSPEFQLCVFRPHRSGVSKSVSLSLVSRQKFGTLRWPSGLLGLEISEPFARFSPTASMTHPDGVSTGPTSRNQ